MKALKIIGKIIGKVFKLFVLITMGLWAFIGIGTMFKKHRTKPELNPFEADVEIVGETFEEYKKWFKSLF